MDTSQYTDAAFARPTEVCDVIMKGGLASGVVYPLAIVEIAKRFRFASVGGTSAGAHAAAVAAAAEYGRHVPGKGFVRLAQAPKEIAHNNPTFLQPVPALRPLFNMFMAAIGGKGGMGIALAAIRGFFVAAIIGVLPGLVLAALGIYALDLSLTALGLVLALVGLVLGVGLAVLNAATRGLRRHDYGLCTGKTQRRSGAPGNTDWLADLIDDVAGRDLATDPPLTFGDLAAASGGGSQGIELRMMTTNLTLRRPYSLPLNDATYAFRLSDFERLFPARIVKYLAAHCERIAEPGPYGDLYKFPDARHLPLVVAARMSASLPLLFCAVPLYARDFTLRRGESEQWRQNLFSDGGLSSNFPIHFFDRMLPSWPTFAISLDEYDERRQPENAPPPEEPRSRVWLPDPKVAQSGLLIPGQPLNGLGSFLFRLIDAAKDWQDNLQGTLAGYRDRIVHVNLKPGEGGINLTMPPDVALTLATYGATAGTLLRDEFNFDEHRWRRFLVAMTRLDETIKEFAAVYDDETRSFADFLARYADNPPHSPISYKQSADDLKTLLARARALATLGREWRSQNEVNEASLPHPKAEMRITPRT